MIPKAFSKLIDKGIDRNIVVFDSENNIFTVRLIDFLMKVGKDNKSPIHTILVSPTAFFCIGGQIYSEARYVINNVTIVYTHNLGVDSLYQNYYLHSGSLESNCTELVLGLVDPMSDHEERILFGCF